MTGNKKWYFDKGFAEAFKDRLELHVTEMTDDGELLGTIICYSSLEEMQSQYSKWDKGVNPLDCMWER